MTTVYRLWHWWLGLHGRDRATIILEVIGILVVTAYTTVAALQWHQMKAATEATKRAADAANESAKAATAANGIAQKALEIAQRAIINIEKIKCEDFKIGGKFRVSYVIHNTGHLAATGLETSPSTMYGPYPVNPAPMHGRWLAPDEKFGNVIGPGEEWPVAFRLGDIPKGMPPQMAKMVLTRHKIEDALRGRGYLQVIFVASYFDGFGKPRTTWRVYTWDPQRGDFDQTSSHQE
jgi:hypothetical protein